MKQIVVCILRLNSVQASKNIIMMVPGNIEDYLSSRYKFARISCR